MKEIYLAIGKINAMKPASVELRLNKATEELGELAKEVNKLTGMKKTKETTEQIMDNLAAEGADTIQCIFSVLLEKGVTYELLIAKLLEKNAKWISDNNEVKE